MEAYSFKLKLKPKNRSLWYSNVNKCSTRLMIEYSIIIHNYVYKLFNKKKGSGVSCPPCHFRSLDLVAPLQGSL